MQSLFSEVFNQQLAASGKSLTQVAHIAGIDRAFVLRLSRGDKCNPSYETVIRLFIALVFDEAIIRKSPTMVEGLSELLLAAAMSSAPHKLMAG